MTVHNVGLRRGPRRTRPATSPRSSPIKRSARLCIPRSGAARFGSGCRIRSARVRFGWTQSSLVCKRRGCKKRELALVPRSNHEVTFGGSRSIAIPEGAEVLSDPVSFAVGSGQNLAISLFTAGETGPATVHGSAFQTNYVSGSGNFAVEVLVPASVKGAVVALGDSITDGASSRLDKNERWTDVLGRRLLDNHIQIAVLNAGIGGNRVLTSAPCWGQNA